MNPTGRPNPPSSLNKVSNIPEIKGTPHISTKKGDLNCFSPKKMAKKNEIEHLHVEYLEEKSTVKFFHILNRVLEKENNNCELGESKRTLIIINKLFHSPSFLSNINRQYFGYNNKTVLHLAVEYGNKEIVNLLLKCGAWNSFDLFTIEKYVKSDGTLVEFKLTPIKLALKLKSNEIVTLLYIERGQYEKAKKLKECIARQAQENSKQLRPETMTRKLHSLSPLTESKSRSNSLDSTSSNSSNTSKLSPKKRKRENIDHDKENYSDIY